MPTKNSSQRRQARPRGASPATKAEFEANIEKYFKDLFRGVMRLTHDRTEAEGITQATLLRFFRLMDSNDWNSEIKNTHAYLMKIAKQIWNDRKRKAAMAPRSYDEAEEFEELDRSAADSGDNAGGIENHIYLKEMLKTVPLKVIFNGVNEYEKQLFYLKNIEEMSFTDISNAVGKSPKQVRNDLNRLQAKIRFRARQLAQKADKELFGAWKELHAKREKLAS